MLPTVLLSVRRITVCIVGKAIPRRGSFVVHVYFSNGNRADLPGATEVRGEGFAIFQPGEVRDGNLTSGIACYDADGKVVARFQADEILGWSVE
jgi:hypothetical protein